MAKQNAPVPGHSLAQRIEGIEEALELAQGRVDPDALDSVSTLLERTRSRRELSAEHTVIGFFGATGSGKSSLFNAVIGSKVATSAARRPTTSTAQAAIWGKAGSEQLLDWLEVENRVFMDGSAEQAAQSLNSAEVPKDGGLWQRMKSAVGRAETETRNGGLILLDLPDFDSVEKSNRAIVERMAGYVDVLVWVFDPQKYADAVIHHEFIKPLAEHGAVTMAVLNQSDRLATGEIAGVLDSLQRLLAEDGLTGTMLAAPIAVSARTGDGIDRLRSALGRVAVEKSAAVQRIEADLDTAVDRLLEHDGGGEPVGVTSEAVATLERDLYQSANAPAVVKAAGESYKLHASSHTGWIPTRWLLKMRKDPLKRLNLHREDSGAEITRSSLPPFSPAQRSAVSSAIRHFANDVSDGVGEPWSHSIRTAARTHEEQLPQGLERAISLTDFKAQKKQWWWSVLNVVQWLCLVTMVAGLVWLTALAVAAYFQIVLPDPPTVQGFPLPVPTLLVITGLLAGILVALFGKLIALAGHRIYTRRIAAGIERNITDVAESYVVAPTTDEIRRHSTFRELLGNAR